MQPIGTARLPFVCDNKPHVVAMQAFGALTPIAAASFTVSLGHGHCAA